MDEFDFSDMLDEWATPLEIQLKSGNDGGHYVAGVWKPDEGETLKINEPLLPPNSKMTYGMNGSVQEGGTVETYDMEWYSHRSNVAINTIVKDVNLNRTFRVKGSNPYTSVSDITIYGLEAVTSNGQAV